MPIRMLPIAIVVVASAVLFAAEENKSKIAPSPAFDKMKTLVGSWEGTADEAGKKMPVNARFKLMSDGSVLAGWLNEGTPNEMLTMFHMDGSDMMATHYCSAHNQPRMVLITGGDPNRLVFKFKDGTNIKPGSGHMQQVAFVIDSPNHHVEEWTYLDGGKEQTGRFDFKRKQ